jgi:ABC-2 type transport system permease protein
MLTLIRTELLALRTIRTTWALVAAAVGLTAGLAVHPVITAGKAGAASLGTVGAALSVLGAIGRGSLVILILGVVTVTAEFRHRTVTATLLGSPRRGRVLAAKGAAIALVGLAVAVANLGVVTAVGLTTGAAHAGLLNTDIILRLLGLALAYPLYGLIGVGIGALVIYQPVAVLLPLAWVLFLEDLALHLVPRAMTPWSLGGMTAALANDGHLTDVLPVAVGGIALSAFALLVLGLGTGRVVRRDIS